MDFTARVSIAEKFDSRLVVSVPQSMSMKLPSRGMTLVEGKVNDKQTLLVLEPDGQNSHWFALPNVQGFGSDLKSGDCVHVSMTPSRNWPEPLVPHDFALKLHENVEVHELWNKITPMARWDWIRWIGATKNASTRAKRIAVACSKLKSGMRRACCFDRSQCTLTV